MYEQYSNFKQEAYYRKSRRNGWIIENLAPWVVQVIYPVARCLRFSNKQVLDIGSGAGLYSAMCRKWGNQVVEIEPHLTNAYGNTATIKTSFADYEPDRQFDIVLCFDVLEHIPEEELPAFFEKVRSLLSSEGQIAIKVPNASAISGLESHFGDLTHHRALNLLSLTDLLRQNNFHVDSIEGVGPNLSISRLAARLLSLPFAIMLRLFLASYGISGEALAPSLICKASVSR